MRKTSLRDAATAFQTAVDDIVQFAERLSTNASQQDASWIYEHAVIRLFREFESLMLHAISGAINNDSSVLSSTLGISFPKHLAQPVCEFVVTGGGYFDFRGRDGLIKDMKGLLGDAHWLVAVVKKSTYKDALNQLISLRNFAAHDSKQSRNRAKESLNLERLSSAGAWLKRQDRLSTLSDRLKALAAEVHAFAPR